MTRREFLNNLYRRLGNLSREQAEQYLTYYAEMLADRMEEGMSEEEAVASMEDVDTIAQRILQDEGVPPVYPDPAPSGGGSGGEEAPPKRPPLRPVRNWRRMASAALWGLAVLAVVFAVKKHFFQGGLGTSGSESTLIDESSTVPDWELSAIEGWTGELEMSMDGIDVEGFHIGSDGIWYSEDDEVLYIGPKGIQYDGEDGSFYMGPGGIRVDEKAVEERTESADYVGAFYEVNTDGGVMAVEISWSSGQVFLQSGGGDTIQFQEVSDSSESMRYELKNGTLFIEGGGGDRQLNVLLPDSRSLSLTVNGYSSDVWATDLEARAVYINNTDGDTACSNLDVDDLTVYTTSGDIVLSDTGVEYTLEATASSGDIVLSGVRSSDMNISATSGCITGTGSATNWNVSTGSGDISLFPSRSDCLSLTATSGQVHLEPARNTSAISVDTSSGDVELAVPGQDFYLSYSTSSGRLDRGGVSLTVSGSTGEYWNGNGSGCSVTVNTTSGDLTLLKG